MTSLKSELLSLTPGDGPSFQHNTMSMFFTY